MRLRRKTTDVTPDTGTVSKKKQVAVAALKVAGAAAVVAGTAVVLKRVRPAIAKSGFLQGEAAAKLGTAAKQTAKLQFEAMAAHYLAGRSPLTRTVANTLFETIRSKSPATLRQLAPDLLVHPHSESDPVVRAEIAPGVRVEDAAHQLISVADQFGKPVQTEFSGCPVEARPGMTPDELIKKFEEAWLAE